MSSGINLHLKKSESLKASSYEPDNRPGAKISARPNGMKIQETKTKWSNINLFCSLLS